MRGLAERIGLGADAVVGLPAPFPAPYVDAWVGLLRARALITAVRVGVFDALPGSTEEVAQRCGTVPERTAVLLEALRSLRYVRRRGAAWRATRRARPFFGPGAKVPLEATVGELAAANWDAMTGLDDVVRGGDPPGLHDRPADDPVWVGYQAAMAELNALSADLVAGMLPLREPRRTLDIGGGPGAFAAALCRRHPSVSVVVADLPPAAALGRERIERAGLAGRVTYVEGDATATDLGEGYDAVTLNSVLHNVDRDTALALLAKARACAAPGALVAVLEVEGAGTQIGALASLVFCAWMGARAFTGDELRTLAAEAGLRDARLRRPLRLNGSVLLLARR